MNSREKILRTVRNNQPAFVELPVWSTEALVPRESLAEEFAAMLGSIGGKAYSVSGFDDVVGIIKEKFAGVGRILSNCPELSGLVVGGQGEGMEAPTPGIEVNRQYDDAHALADTALAILRAHFGVAENAAVWLTEEGMIERALPFICQELAVVIDKKDIVATMHEAYDRIAGNDYGFGVFIAGPSKTADIEQSLVLGAHGPVSMTVFILE